MSYSIIHLWFFLYYRQGSYKLIESDEQQQHHHHHHQSHAQHQQHGQHQQHPQNHAGGGSRKSGYVNSGAETETETTSHASIKRNRRRQR